MSNQINPTILCILDGWGYSEHHQYNAIAQAKLPFFSNTSKIRPKALLDASGKAVGMPADQMGNSEVGHITIGSGRIVLQDLERINLTIKNKEFQNNEAIIKYINYCKQTNKAIHLIGLASDGGVHSHLNHFLAAVNLMNANKIKFFIHIITDGRDVPPKSATQYIQTFIEQNFQITSICGRFYAMDRDQRFERTEKYYNALLNENAKKFSHPFEMLDQYKSDEFVEPHISINYPGIKNGDCIFMINFRADRVRQIMTAFLDPTFKNFKTENLNLKGLCMTSYASNLAPYVDIAFPKITVQNTLGEIIAKNNLNQLRIAETEKYAHVTYFLNGNQEIAYANEDRIIVPSPKVLTYDLFPEMSAYELTDKLIAQINLNKYHFICVNFANADMVGHTANIEATIKACEVIDSCLEKIFNLLHKQNGQMLVTADHGNAEQLFDHLTNQHHTAHTKNKVPVIYFGDKNIKLRNGELKDIAPTILELMNINIPTEMTGTSLIEKIF